MKTVIAALILVIPEPPKENSRRKQHRLHTAEEKRYKTESQVTLKRYIEGLTCQPKSYYLTSRVASIFPR